VCDPDRSTQLCFSDHSNADFTDVLSKGGILTPSDRSQASNYWEVQNEGPLIVDGRYVTTPCLVAVPIEVYHPSFAVFRALANSRSLDPDESTVLHTAELMRVASQIATSSSARETPARMILGKLLSYTFVETASKYEMTSDQASLTICKEPAIPLGDALLAVIEEKAELRTSGDPSIQGSFSYIRHWADPNQQASTTYLPFLPDSYVLYSGSEQRVLLPFVHSCACRPVDRGAWCHFHVAAHCSALDGLHLARRKPQYR
jgi:hypothetical protein